MTSINLKNIRQEFSKQPTWLFINNVKKELHKEVNTDELYVYNFLLGRALLSQRKFNAALSHLDCALKVKETYEAYFWKGHTYYDQSAFAEAIINYTKVIELNPEHDEAYYYIGLIYASEQKHKETITYLEKSIALNPNNYDANIKLGNAYTSVNRYADSLKLKFQYNSMDIEEILVIGRAHWSTGNQDQGLTTLKAGLTLETDDKTKAKLLTEIGIKTYFKRNGNNLDLALTYLEKALELNNSDAQTHGAIASVLTKKNELAKAKEHFKKSFEIEPNHPRRLYNYSLFLLQENNDEAALEALEKAVIASPYDRDICFQLGSIYAQKSINDKSQELLLLAERQGHPTAAKLRLEKFEKIANDFMKEGSRQFQDRQYESAIESFKNAANLFEEEVEFKGDIAYTNITSCLNNIGYSMAILKNTEGESYLKRAIERDTTYIDAINNLGNFYLQLNKPHEAIKQFNNVKQLNSNFGSAYFNAGKVYLEQLKEYDKALEEINVAVKIYTATGPDQLANDARYLRGKCHEVMGNYSEAKEDYYQAYADSDADRTAKIINDNS